MSIDPLHIPCRQCLVGPGDECRWPAPKGVEIKNPRFHRIREDHAMRAAQLMEKP